MMKLLLISSSKTHGTTFLEHAAEAIKRHFESVRRITFIPYAGSNLDAYARLARSALRGMGFESTSVHEMENPASAIRESEAIFTGGGNTFRLLKSLYDHSLIEPIRERVLNGAPYMGSSAGTNIACPTIRTTNDMPIVQPPGFTALNLIPFQINPHFLDADPDSSHQGETRETRLREYLEENELPVLGLREGCWLEITGQQGSVGGENGAVLFRRGESAQQLATGDAVDPLLMQASS